MVKSGFMSLKVVVCEKESGCIYVFKNDFMLLKFVGFMWIQVVLYVVKSGFICG